MKKLRKIPEAIGPYSIIYKIKNITMISGQIPINIKNNSIPKKISEQTKVVLKNIKNIIKENNLKIKNIAKITIFTTNLNDIKKINKIYKNFFKKYTKKFPARTCVEVSKLPKNVNIEIDAIVIK
ncbi:Rid family detoxifying hydrolase [Buchnera aphidicola (Ceratoglyphina bambusae)]|uniref:Rid family detoxifying hydrolase n=1 Tax=Buchnera aphidicola TaxID=9 RepID=UPI0031B8A508